MTALVPWLDKVSLAVGRSWSMVVHVQNPFPIVFDRMGWKREDYNVNLRNGMCFRVRSKTSDAYSVYETAIRDGSYFQFSTISPGDTVVDIGANIGVFTVLAAKLAGPTGRVVAIEPHPETARYLRHNVALNGLTNVTVRQVAVAGTAGVMSLHAGDKPLFASLLAEVNGHRVRGKSEDVAVMTVAELLAEEGVRHVDFMKIDCEGSEYSIFDTAPATLWPQVSYIAMEAHAAAGRKVSELTHKLRAEGYQVRESELIYASRNNA